MMEKEVLTSVINAGVGGAISALIIYLIYRLVARLTMDVGMKMVAAFESQAKSMDSLTKSLQEYIARDNSEHREMLVLLKYIAAKQQGFEIVEREHYERKRQCQVMTNDDYGK